MKQARGEPRASSGEGAKSIREGSTGKTWKAPKNEELFTPAPGQVNRFKPILCSLICSDLQAVHSPMS